VPKRYVYHSQIDDLKKTIELDVISILWIVCFYFVSSIGRKRQVVLHFEKNFWWRYIYLHINHWCSRDRNLRDRDFKVCAFCRNSFKKCCHHFWLEFFSNFWRFPTCFGCFLPANTTNKNRWIIEILINHFFAIFKVSRPENFDTATRKNGSRDRHQVPRLHHWY